ncbi:hypothetical protein PF003_g2716 [Phytophthora fragariae]|nr:hypothetical protein PF003_g2716 [Phytophthora fragariae]
MLAVLLSPTPAAAMLVVLLSLCRPPAMLRHAALAVPATATLAVPLWPGSPECCPTVAHAAAMLTLSPCCCRCACRECPPCCAPLVPAAAMPAVLRSLWPAVLRLLCLPPPFSSCCCRPRRPPPCSSCCSAVPATAYARRAAVAGLTGMLPDGRPCRRHAHAFRHAAVDVLAVNARRAALAVPAAAMPAVLRSLCLPPPFSSCCSRCAGRRHARRAALAVLAAAMLVMLLSLSPATTTLAVPAVAGLTEMLPRRSPVPPPCSTNLALLLSQCRPPQCPPVLRSLCRPPQCPPCCARCAGRRHARHASSRCPRYRYARRKAVAGLAEMLADGRPRR